MHTYLIQHRLAEAAAKHPEKIAVSCGDQSLSYAAYEQRTNAIANHLRAGLVDRQAFVPFFMDKSVDSLVSMLSILKSDAAYVPIDVNSPPERAAAILRACSANLVIVNSDSAERFESVVKLLERPPQTFKIDTFEGEDTSAPRYRNLSIDIAYVLFTSGSTGIPKGVMIPHRAIFDYIDWCIDEYQITANDRVANHAPLYFDNSTFDVYTAFFSGAELHLVDSAINAVIVSLIKWIENRKISIFFCVPSVLSMLLKTRRLKPELFENLRHMICAGEVLPPDTLRQWMELYPHIQYTNMYGPTEITVDCTFHVFDSPPSEGTTAVPIGKARPNMELFVRDESGTLSKASGARGELLVRGTSVAYGYLSDPAKTQAGFIQHPGQSAFHDKLYCTGDLVEISKEGDLYFLGRADDQIKYLGHRIELGEIESHLVALECVDEGVIVFNHAAEATEQAIGAMVGVNQPFDPSSLRQLLSERLPGYMVPTLFVEAKSEFPRTPNGKYDRREIAKLVFAET